MNPLKLALPFTEDDIAQLANKLSYQHGEEYYDDGCVRKITCIGNLFKGLVNGSEKIRGKA